MYKKGSGLLDQQHAMNLQTRAATLVLDMPHTRACCSSCQRGLWLGEIHEQGSDKRRQHYAIDLQTRAATHCWYTVLTRGLTNCHARLARC
eukprot:559608-Pelagomonas_calceolata.AAC.8